MSSTKRGTVREVNDFYPTPQNTIDSIFALIDFSKVKSFLEPCRGNGAIFNRKELNNCEKHWAELSEGVDYFETTFPHVDLIVTNPPFNLSQQFLDKSLTEADTIVYLQRLNWLGSKKRKPWWENKKAALHIGRAAGSVSWK